MKNIFFFLSVLMIAGASWAQGSYCITVNDVCCDANTTSGSYSMLATDNFTTHWIYYDTGSSARKVEIKWEVDGVVQHSESLCGCGVTSFNYIIANTHTLTVKVKYISCNSTGCSTATSTVKVYSPSDNNPCKQECP